MHRPTHYQACETIWPVPLCPANGGRAHAMNTFYIHARTLTQIPQTGYHGGWFGPFHPPDQLFDLDTFHSIVWMPPTVSLSHMVLPKHRFYHHSDTKASMCQYLKTSFKTFCWGRQTVFFFAYNSPKFSFSPWNPLNMVHFYGQQNCG